MRYIPYISLFSVLLLFSLQSAAQISPGPLTEFHAHLEGMSNCTHCHDLGEHVSGQKCLACHKELKSRIDQNKGFHASGPVAAKKCTECHSDHLSRKYDIVHLDKKSFDHRQTGYILEGKHKETRCEECHKPENIRDKEIAGKKLTFLGLTQECLGCHKDYHQGTMQGSCLKCHSYDSFKQAGKFDHQTTRFPLKGRHLEVGCIKCHPTETKNGQETRSFRGLAFDNCSSCHKDVHQSRFGKDCQKCHSEESFRQVKGITGFNHVNTGFPLEGKHAGVDCRSCHKGSLTARLEHGKCSSCHKDFHKGEFTRNHPKSDCADCHSAEGFKETTYSTERHNGSAFPLGGAHLATPCSLCHQTRDVWRFAGLEKKCTGCHENIHRNRLDEKFIPEGRCDHCHTVSSWSQMKFDHEKTTFQLRGRHSLTGCRGCHFRKEQSGAVTQVFTGLDHACTGCHTDVHCQQFAVNGATDCQACHGFDHWKAVKFDHNRTRFKLDGSHMDVACNKCHRISRSGSTEFIQYKNTDRQCKSCHF